jgi:hypothetical protein
VFLWRLSLQEKKVALLSFLRHVVIETKSQINNGTWTRHFRVLYSWLLHKSPNGAFIIVPIEISAKKK